MLPKQVVTHKTLLDEGLDSTKIKTMTINLSLFPTPFKKIYYIPTSEERKATTIDKPMMILTRAIAAYLGTHEFYYSCRTAEEFFGIKWQPTGDIHVVNNKLSRTINLNDRIKRNSEKTNYRAKRISKIVSLYGGVIVFHRGSVAGAKFKETPYGRFALKSQIKRDRKRFKEKINCSD
ncbi:MAG: hypothetical protein ABH842_05440 [Candidatus Micrarchaeota archaeon]